MEASLLISLIGVALSGIKSKAMFFSNFKPHLTFSGLDLTVYRFLLLRIFFHHFCIIIALQILFFISISFLAAWKIFFFTSILALAFFYPLS